MQFASGDAGELLARNPRSFDVVDVDSFGLTRSASDQAAADGGVILIATTAPRPPARGARPRGPTIKLSRRVSPPLNHGLHAIDATSSHPTHV